VFAHGLSGNHLFHHPNDNLKTMGKRPLAKGARARAQEERVNYFSSQFLTSFVGPDVEFF
jgi:hypothetical protein